MIQKTEQKTAGRKYPQLPVQKLVIQKMPEIQERNFKNKNAESPEKGNCGILKQTAKDKDPSYSSFSETGASVSASSSGFLVRLMSSRIFSILLDFSSVLSCTKIRSGIL